MLADKRTWRQKLHDMRVVARLLRHRGCPRWECWLLAWLIEVRHHSLTV